MNIRNAITLLATLLMTALVVTACTAPEQEEAVDEAPDPIAEIREEINALTPAELIREIVAFPECDVQLLMLVCNDAGESGPTPTDTVFTSELQFEGDLFEDGTAKLEFGDGSSIMAGTFGEPDIRRVSPQELLLALRVGDDLNPN